MKTTKDNVDEINAALRGVRKAEQELIKEYKNMLQSLKTIKPYDRFAPRDNIYTDWVTYKGFELEVELYYTPGEPATRDYPGCGDCLEIREVYLNGVDVYELLEYDLDEIEKILRNQ